MKKLLIALLVLATVYGVYLGVLLFSEHSLLYPGLALRSSAQPPVVPGLEQVSLHLPFGRVDALLLAPRASRGGVSRSSPAIIFAHGNGELADPWASRLEPFRDLGMAVLIVEYPGYGRSEGRPSETSIRATFAAAYDHLTADPRVDRTRIVGFGESLGGAAVCLLARQRSVRALVLQSAFTSLAPFAAHFLAPACLLRDRFDNIAALRGYDGPVLVIHGRADTIVPLEQGRELAASARHATLLVYDCGHSCWDPDRLPFWHDVTSFLAKAGILEEHEA
jgi:fermentation-respiration switch protein FrsA (DUF1100 family)